MTYCNSLCASFLYLGAAVNDPAAMPLLPMLVHWLPVARYHHRSLLAPSRPATYNSPPTPAGETLCNTPFVNVHACQPPDVPSVYPRDHTPPHVSSTTTLIVPFPSATTCGSALMMPPP